MTTPQLPFPSVRTYDGFAARVVTMEHLWRHQSLKITGKFFYLPFRGDIPTIDEFVDFIYWQIVPFCIPYSERRRLLNLFDQTGDYRYLHELTDKARTLFVSARKSLDTSGEPGELILFVLLEAVLQAPQIACKMYLKTSVQVPVHGSDGIHILRGDEGDSLCLIWGESKLYGRLSEALDAICASLKDFVSVKDGSTPRHRDITILKDHANIEDPGQKRLVLDYFDPYSPRSNKLSEAHACLAGFDSQLYKDVANAAQGGVDAYFRNKYMLRINSACELFAEKILAAGLHDLTFYFLLLPFPSVEELRRKFFAKLGLVDQC